MLNKKDKETLSDKIEIEGDGTWGCKDGWCDVEDVKQFIKDLKEIILGHYDEKKQEVVNVFEDNKPAIKVELNPIIKKIDKLAGDKLI